VRRADRRAIVATLRDGGPLRSWARRAFLASRAVRRALAGLPVMGTVAIAGPRRALLAAAVVHGAHGRTAVTVDDVAAAWPRCDAALLVDALVARDRDAQEQALRGALAAVAAGGTVTVVEVDGARRVRSAVARARARRAAGEARGRGAGPGAVRTARAWATLLTDLGGADPHLTPSRRVGAVDARASVRVVVAHPSPSGAGPRVARPASAGPTAGRCGLCGSLRRRVALRHADGVLVRCRACGFVSVDPLPAPVAALAQYDEGYFRGDRGYRDYAAEEVVFRAVFRRRVTRLRAFGARGRVLDVGAATGAFLVEARALGFAGAGVEPSAWAAQRARDAGFDVVTGTLEGFRAPGEARAGFDLVTSFDVVEHLVDPVAGLRALARYARPGALVAVTVPDFGGGWARACGARWPFVTPREHLHYFTRRTLRAALRTAGLDVLEVSLTATPLSVGTALRATLGPVGASLARALGREADRGMPFPFGSILGVARRPRGPAGVGASPAARRGSGCS